MGSKHASLFSEKTVIPRLQASAKIEVLSEMVDCLVTSGTVTASKREPVLRALREREKLGSTGVGGGVAIPHVKLDFLRTSVAAVGVAPQGIDYAAVDGEPVFIVFMLISPTDKASEHLSALQWISRMARHRDFIRFMRASSTPAEVLGLFEELG
ncbi:MAG: PTS sugar transporter subunit IIA [Planctomycetota bacterium]